MKHLIEYSSKVEVLFFQYLKGFISLEEFIEDLYEIESVVRKKYKSSTNKLWFRLYEGYTGSETIGDLELNLDPQYATKENLDFVRNSMWQGINLGNRVEIYFS